MTDALSIYKSALGRIGLPFEDGLVGKDNHDSVQSAMNAGLKEMSVDHDWLYSYTERDIQFTQGVTVYPTPQGWLRTGFIVLKDSGLELMPLQRREHFRVPSTGTPRYFDTSGDKILISPAPSTAVQAVHGYFERLPVIDFDPDDPVYPDIYSYMADIDLGVPSPFDELIVLYVAKAVCVVMGDRDMHQMISSEIRDYRSKIEDNRRRQQGTGRIKSRQDY